MNFDFPELMLSFAVLSILLLIGQMLRAKVGVLQKIFLPAALIGGMLGLILGPQVVGIIPIPDITSALPGFLISIFYACILIGGLPEIRGEVRRISKFYLTFVSAYCIEIALGMGLVLFALQKYFSGLPTYMGLMIWTGFYGGHGTAAAIGSALGNLGFEDATGLGMAAATIGLISGVTFGVVLINWGVRKGYAESLNIARKIPDEIRTGIIPRSKEPSNLGRAFISSETIDPLAFVVALVGASCGVGFALSKLLQIVHPFLENIPLFVLALLGGALVRVLMEKTNLDYLYDETAAKRIQGLALDYLIIAGISTIPLKTVAQYLVPLSIMAAATWITVPLFLIYVGPRLLGDAWFEKMVVIYGTMHGVFATGILLLRIIDPDFRTPALLEGGAVVAIDCVFSYSLIVIFAPILIVTYPVVLFILPLILVIATLGASLYKSKTS